MCEELSHKHVSPPLGIVTSAVSGLHALFQVAYHLMAAAQLACRVRGLRTEFGQPAPQMVGNSSIRISWGRSSANRNAAGVALGMGMAGGFPQTGAFGRFGDSGGLAAAYGGFAAQAPGVMDPCALHRCSRPLLQPAEQPLPHLASLIKIVATPHTCFELVRREHNDCHAAFWKFAGLHMRCRCRA